MAAGSVPTGCYKCGEPGHWSTDCPHEPGAGTATSPGRYGGPGHDARKGVPSVPRPPHSHRATPQAHARPAPRPGSNAFPSPSSRPKHAHAGMASGGGPPSAGEHHAGAHSQSHPPNGDEDAPAPASGDDAPPGEGRDGAPGGAEAEKGLKAVSQRRRKLTPDTLLDPEDGLPFLLGDVAAQLLPCINGGRGNELRDVRNLLEGYARWQKRIFPAVTLREFLEKIEKLGTNRHLKVSVRDLLYRGSEEQEPDTEGQQQQQQRSQRGDGEAGPRADPGFPDPFADDDAFPDVDSLGAWGDTAWDVRRREEMRNASGPAAGPGAGGSPVPGAAAAGQGQPEAAPRGGTDGAFAARPGMHVGGDPGDDEADAGGFQWWDQEEAEPATATARGRGDAPKWDRAGDAAGAPQSGAEPESGSAPMTGEGRGTGEGASGGEPVGHQWGQGWGARKQPGEGEEDEAEGDWDSMMPAPGLRRRHRGPAAASSPGVAAAAAQSSPGPAGASPSTGRTSRAAAAGSGARGSSAQGSPGPAGASPSSGKTWSGPDGSRARPREEAAGGGGEEGLGLEDVLEGVGAVGSAGAGAETSGAAQPGGKRRRIARMVLEDDDDDE